MRSANSDQIQRNDAFDAYGTYPIAARPKQDAFAEGVQRTQYALSMIFKRPLIAARQPIVTGTSVLAITYKDGIMMAADTLGSHLLPRSHSAF
jgi:20S proteasome subunit beta 7